MHKAVIEAGARRAFSDRFMVNFMGAAAFGMTGLDFETAVRSNTPILTIVLNNFGMAAPRNPNAFTYSPPQFGIRDLSDNYADMAAAMSGWAERVEDPSQVGPAILRARKATQEGRAALLEFITSQEVASSRGG